MSLMKLEGGFFIETSDSKYYRRDYKDGTLVPSSQEAYAAWLSKQRVVSSIEWSEWDVSVPGELFETRNGKWYWFIDEGGLISLFKENTSTSEGVGYEGAQYLYSVVSDLSQCTKLIGHEETLSALNMLGCDFGWVSKSIDQLGLWQNSPDLFNYDNKTYDISVMISEEGNKFISIKEIRFGSKKTTLANLAKKVESPF